MKKLLLGALISLVGVNVYAGTSLLITFKPQNSGTKVSKAQAETQRQQLMADMSVEKTNQIAKVAGHKFIDVGPLATGGRIIEFDEDLSPTEVKQVIQKLQQENDILYVSENIIFYPASNETNNYQWDMFNSTTNVPGVLINTYYGDNFFSSLTNNNPATTNLGSIGSGVVVAVLDTGYTPHPNFLSHLEANGISGYGYDFITDCRRAGTCAISTSDRDAVVAPSPNGLDMGDYLTSAQYSSIPSGSFKASCSGAVGNSSWHGTHVTGTVIGQGSSNTSTNTNGVLGGAYNANVMPIRALGKCGGTMGDIINGMMWAAGYSVGTIAAPAKPANVINMSLRGLGSTPGCPADYQNVVNKVIANGVIIVAAAGNDSVDASFAQPANCTGVIAVGAAGPTGRLTSYSNYGPTVTISASGGDRMTNGGILSTMYNSSESYGSCTLGASCFNYQSDIGTSMAAPHVAAAVADILAAKPNATNSDVIQILQSSAVPFAGSNCYFSQCVPNLRLNAESAVYYASSVPLLTPNPTSLNFISSSLTNKTLTITNNNSNSVTLGDTIITTNTPSSFAVYSSTCTKNTVLAQNTSCTITVKVSNIVSTDSYMATLYLQNIDGLNVASAALSVTVNGIDPTPTPSPAPVYTTSGGCTMVEGSNDIGMILLLMVISAYYYRRKKVK